MSTAPSSSSKSAALSKKAERKRLLAFAVDALITLGLTAGLGALTGFSVRVFFARWSEPVTDDRVLVFLVELTLCWLVYRGLSESGGRTVGKWLYGLEVEGPQGEPGIARAMARALLCIPNQLLHTRGKEAPIDAFLGTQVRDAPSLRKERQARGVVAVVIWSLLAAAATRHGLRPTFRELQFRFGYEHCFLWCGTVDNERTRAILEEGEPVCEDIVTELVRMRSRGDLGAKQQLLQCDRAERMEAGWWP